MADVKQMKKIVPLITCKIPFSQHVCELVFGVDILDLNLGIQINSCKSQEQLTLWVLDTYLIVGLLPFDDHFNHCFVVLKMQSIAPN